jgi:hypothetical protein
MNILFLSPWPISDSLTKATVLPGLASLREIHVVDNVYLVCPNARSQTSIAEMPEDFFPLGIQFLPLPLSTFPNNIFRRLISSFAMFSHAIHSLRTTKSKLVVCRGTSGLYGFWLKVLFRVPYIVESFEPHSKYMLQTGTWSAWEPKYIIQSVSEFLVRRTADFFITVSEGYRNYLVTNNNISPSRTLTVPCIPRQEKFFFDHQVRARSRRLLGLEDKIVLVYLGKFGGLYHEIQYLRLWAPLFREYSTSIFLLVLTPQDPSLITLSLRQYGFDESQFHVTSCHHSEVNEYLNAADIALSFINAGAWSFACSPVKHGEYWACGLPLIMPYGIGDESKWLEADKMGSMANFSDSKSISSAFIFTLDILSDPDHRSRIQSLGNLRRNPALITDAYHDALSKLNMLG